MTKTIGILGCGWLGLPLAQSLLKKGYRVLGSTTTPSKRETLQNSGIVPYRITLGENGIDGDIEGFLCGLDILVLNVPPALKGPNPESYERKMEHLAVAAAAHPPHHLIFISSTSVYGDIPGRINEDTPPAPQTEAGKQLLASEKMFWNIPNLNTTIIRFGGLIGPGRHPVTYLAGRKNLPNGQDPINLIHINDCIGLLETVLTYQNLGHQTINGVYPYHPSKEEYYTSEAHKRGITPPTYLADSLQSTSKIVENGGGQSQRYTYMTTIIS